MAKDLKKAEYFLAYKGLLTEKQRTTLEMYYVNDLTLSEISEQMKITRQGVFNCITKTVERLDKLEKEIGLVRKRDASKELFDKLEKAVESGKKDEALKAVKKLKELF